VNALDLLLFAICAASCLRLLFYRRSGARFKRHISIVAYLLILLTGGLALALLTGRIAATDIHPLVILALALLTAAVYYARGNIAHIIRMTRIHRWN
jgi:uncharacterized membrane protein